ncbi:crotonase/enoyl-CoA hydratase family protein [Tropicibacter naphthalenivorans]|uniref:2,3-dehydroadipyl-CoA hydratase n=1 Tax=Tropicibacter naphthalenivorans TaxID=441103 RepID=A0A0P1G2E4_9RHOB|nr:crotonase/enoyl-CoA hydratase family protein [Tropicibacter naphthalenivorans]CUH75966.1 2,3-dehydroadipyl-CoA hydratase [Tropicibacter naphthalenivorans]SMC40938.1 vanillin synthase /trans-feruloyl-CoA hydratase [Tropicibacter naphthalenivorans]
MSGTDTAAGADLVTYELRGDVALIGLNRPVKRNAISDRFVEAIFDAVVKAQREAKAGVIFGHGAHFCAGLDLSEHSEKPLFEAVQGSRRWHAVFDQIERGTIPWVAAITGAAVGGGFELAASVQLRVADEKAFFALPEGQRGIFVGGGGSVRISRLIGPARMGDMMLTGRSVSAADMERWGGVSYVVPEGEALDKALELAARTAQNAQFTNYAIINALPRIADMSSEDGLFAESMVASLATMTDDAKERLRAFLEKRAEKVQAPE